MRSIRLVFTVPSRAPDDVYATIADFARYPQLSAAVRQVTVSPVDATTSISSWEVNFRSGILRWVEEDTFDAAGRRIDFRQTDGDIATFEGSWTCAAEGGDVTVTFDATIDLGIPSLADALEPIAVRTLVSNMTAIVAGLFGEQVRRESTADASVSARASAG